MAKYQFETEVSKLLKLIVHSLYSNNEIFLRELISNSSDALDKLKFLTVSDESLKSLKFEPRVDIVFDEQNKTITVRDTGLGMNDEDLRNNLGTIARSGTSSFLEKLANEQKKDSNLIGQFGVGFYSVFMVASKVEVITKKAGEEKVWKWTSDGTESYEIEECGADAFPLIDDVPEDSCGSCIVAHLTDEHKDFASRWRIQEIIKKYSDHIAFPIYLHYVHKEYDDKGNVKSEAPKSEQINDASALWQKQKSSLKEEDYFNFYKSFSHDGEDPLHYVHTKAEGTQEYTTLFYIPSKAPFDMFHADYKPGVKLFVKRVFITDDDKDLLPTYLRFVRGIIDSEDLPLNVSREILQQNRVLSSIKSASVKKILGELKKLSENDKEKYVKFIAEFNKPLKEGLYSDFENREKISDLVRFKTTADQTENDGWTSFAEYVERMGSEQKAIYYIAGDDEKTLRQSPHIEAYKAKGIEVLLMTDEIDEIVIPTLNKYKEFELKAANRADLDDALTDSDEKAKIEKQEKDFKDLLEKMKTELGESVKEVRISKRLSDSPACITFDDKDPSLQMARMMKAMGQTGFAEAPPILEVNASHPILQKMKDSNDEAYINDFTHVLLDQAKLAEGGELSDPAEFVKRLNKLLS
ncbi:MAG: molecular chaperone HtpG [Treponema sp.]|nr:MAG: molecular chaperone HtpG [Treponema sp.]